MSKHISTKKPGAFERKIHSLSPQVRGYFIAFGIAFGIAYIEAFAFLFSITAMIPAGAAKDNVVWIALRGVGLNAVVPFLACYFIPFLYKLRLVTIPVLTVAWIISSQYLMDLAAGHPMLHLQFFWSTILIFGSISFTVVFIEWIIERTKFRD